MRERFLFIFVGLLVGLFVGFVFAGSISQRPVPANPVTQMPASVSNALDDARRQPDNFDAQVKAAELYYQIQRFDDALTYLLKANKIQPDNFETIANLAIVSLEGGHPDEAEKWFKLALTRQPDNASVLDGYCSVLLQRGNVKEAEAAIIRLERLDPGNSDIPQLRAELQNVKSR